MIFCGFWLVGIHAIDVNMVASEADCACEKMDCSDGKKKLMACQSTKYDPEIEHDEVVPHTSKIIAVVKLPDRVSREDAVDHGPNQLYRANEEHNECEKYK
jgi:hypothetical protein